MDFVMGFIQQGVARVVEGAVTGAGGFAGDVVNGAGDMIEASGRGVGNRAFQGWGDYINSYGNSIVAATSPSGVSVSTSKALVKKGSSAVTKASQSASPKATPQKALPYKPPQKLLPAPPSGQTSQKSIQGPASKPYPNQKALPAPSGTQSALNGAKNKSERNAGNMPKTPEAKQPGPVKKVNNPKSTKPKSSESNTSAYKPPLSKPPATKAASAYPGVARSTMSKSAGPKPVTGLKR